MAIPAVAASGANQNLLTKHAEAQPAPVSAKIPVATPAPSAITHISPEGLQRSQRDETATVPQLQNPTPVQRRTAIDAAVEDAAGAATVSVGARPPTPGLGAQRSERVDAPATAVSALEPRVAPTPPPTQFGRVPAFATTVAQNPVAASVPPPVDTVNPSGRTAVTRAEAAQPPRDSNARPLARAANEFVAAFNTLRAQRGEPAASPAPSGDAATQRGIAPSATASVPASAAAQNPPVSPDGARFNVSTFAVGVARNNVTPTPSPAPTAAPERPQTNDDTRRLARIADQPATRPPSNGADDRTVAPVPAARPTSPPAVTAADNAQPGAPDHALAQNGLPQRLNALANLLTP